MKKETTESRVEHEIVYQLNTPFLTKENAIKYYILLDEFFVIKRKESTNIGHNIMCTPFEHNTPNFPMFIVVRQLR